MIKGKEDEKHGTYVAVAVVFSKYSSSFSLVFSDKARTERITRRKDEEKYLTMNVAVFFALLKLQSLQPGLPHRPGDWRHT